MELETRIEKEDLQAFLEHYGARAGSSRFQTIIWIWLLVLITVLAAIRFAENGVSVSSLVWSGIFIIWAFLGKRWLRWLSRRFLSAGLAQQDLSTHLGSQKLSVVSDGLRCDSKAGSSTTSWASVKRIEEGDAHTFIYLSDISALIIPHRSTTADQLDAFLAEIRRRSVT